nr:MAG TPA: YozE [Caudoviricetes sp.]
MTFKKWINKFIEVDLPIGDLSRDIKRDETFPDTNDKEKIISYLESKRVSDIVLSTFNDVWDFYKKSH